MLLADAYLDRIDFLRYLPRTDCGDCGAATCGEFVEDLKNARKKVEDCPGIEEDLYYPFAIALQADRLLPEFPCLMIPRPGPAGLVEINAPDANSPLLVSGNNVHTQEILAAVLATTKSSFFLLFVDTRGDTVDMAVILEHLTPGGIDAAIMKSGILKRHPHVEIVIPGLASGMSHELTRTIRRQIAVGPICAGELPLFFGAGWRPSG